MDAQIVSLLATALGALIAALSYSGKIRHERQRSTRTVLYYLLEIHHFLSRSSLGITSFPKEYLRRITQLLHERGVQISPADAAALPIQLESVLRIWMQSELIKLKTSISVPFEKALHELSRDDPVLAFDLRGKEAISNISELFELLGSNPRLGVLEGEDAVNAKTLMSSLDKSVSSLQIADLVRCIHCAAWRCDLLTNFRVRRRLSKAAAVRSLDDIGPDISAFIAEMADEIALQIRSPAR